MRKNLYIVGARGFGRELALAFPLWPGFYDHYLIKGFLDDKADALVGLGEYPPIVSSVEDFSPGENDVVVCGLGMVQWRRKYIEILLAKGARFETLVHPCSTVFPTARIGVGCLVMNNVLISANVRVDDFVLLHDNVVLGHDTKIGTHSVLENGVFAGGGVRVGSCATIHTRALIVPHQCVGNNAVVGAGSVVIRNVKDGSTVFGNPAQRIDQ